MYFNFVCFLVAAFAILHVMDRFSTETLLNVEKVYQNDSYIRSKLNEERLHRDVLLLEKNRIARFFMRKFGVHNGLWMMSIFVFIPMVTLLIVSTYARGAYSVTDDIVVFVVAFMAGILVHQTGCAVGVRKTLNKIKKEREEL